MKNERRELMYVVPPGLSTREPLHHGFTPMTTTCRHFLAKSSLATPKAADQRPDLRAAPARQPVWQTQQHLWLPSDR